MNGIKQIMISKFKKRINKKFLHLFIQKIKLSSSQTYMEYKKYFNLFLNEFHTKYKIIIKQKQFRLNRYYSVTNSSTLLLKLVSMKKLL